MGNYPKRLLKLKLIYFQGLNRAREEKSKEDMEVIISNSRNTFLFKRKAEMQAIIMQRTKILDMFKIRWSGVLTLPQLVPLISHFQLEITLTCSALVYAFNRIINLAVQPCLILLLQPIKQAL